jgi:primary-amine oxidase
MSLDKSTSKWIIDCFSLLPEQLHPQISVEELIECEVVVKNDPTIQALAKEVGAFFEK